MSTSSRPRLLVEGLGLRWGDRYVVRDLDWGAGPGGIAWVVGPNGAGKSTLLATVAGLRDPDEGTVRLENEGLGRPLVYYDPQMDLPADVSLAGWRAFARSFPDAPGGSTPVELVPPTVRGSRTVGTLSTGERKRLLLDLLLRIPSALTVLDEPYEHLSDDGKALLSSALRRRGRESVVVVATNQEPDVDRTRDGLLRLGGGRARIERPEAGG